MSLTIPVGQSKHVGLDVSNMQFYRWLVCLYATRCERKGNVVAMDSNSGCGPLFSVIVCIHVYVLQKTGKSCSCNTLGESPAQTGSRARQAAQPWGSVHVTGSLPKFNIRRGSVWYRLHALSVASSDHALLMPTAVEPVSVTPAALPLLRASCFRDC